MKETKFDQMMKDWLLKETNEITKRKEEIWGNIQRELFTDTAQHVQRRKKKRHFVKISAIAAMIVLIWAGVSSGPGQALMRNIKDMFVPEKEVEIEIEGQKEQTDVELEVNEELHYVIYVDTSRYKLIEGDVSDKIVPNPELGPEYPDVYMEITNLRDTTLEETVDLIKQELAEENMIIREETKVEEPIQAEMVRAIAATEAQWDTPIHQYYVTEDDEGQLFVIKEVYFLEAAEGHGARFRYMLESFEIVP